MVYFTVMILCCVDFAFSAKMPLLDNIKTPLFAELDVSAVNDQLKDYIDTDINKALDKTLVRFKNETTELKDKIMANFSTNFQEYVENVKTEFSDLGSLFINPIKQVSDMQHSISQLKQEMIEMKTEQKSSSKVFLMSTGSLGTVVTGAIVRFKTLKYHDGISQSVINKFKSNGQFTCENGGLYLITVNILSSISRSWFRIMKNNEELSRTYIANFGSGGSYHSSTGFALAILQPTDSVYVKAGSKLVANDPANTLIIVKLK